jgi:hypothetical protein
MEERGYDQPKVRPTFWTAKRLVLVETLGFSTIIGLISVVFLQNPYMTTAVSLINILGWGVCMLAWIKADSLTRGYQLHRQFPYAVVIFGTFALIYYLFRSRGIFRGFTSVGYFALFAILNVIVGLIAGILLLLIIVLIFGPSILE